MTSRICQPIGCLLAVIALAIPAQAAESEAKKVLLIAGRPSHGYGAHEHFAGCRILADALETAPGKIDATVVRGWPEDASLLEQADSIVIYGDGGGGHLALPHLDQLSKLLDSGKGFVCLHYAVEVPKGEPGDRFLDFLGGYFETDWSVNPHWTADFQELPEHPVTRGVEPFKANDEWYFHMRFRPQMDGVTPILSDVPPEATMARRDGPHSGNPAVRKAVAEQQPQHVAWTFERPDGGRSFGFTGGHYHWNWGNDDIRRLVVNAIAWTANTEIPQQGMPVRHVDIAKLTESQDYEPPKNFSAEEMAERFGVEKAAPADKQETSSEGKSTSTSSAEATHAAQAGKSEKLFASKLITSQTPGHQADIDIDLRGHTELYLLVTDGGNGFACDWADWIDPRISGPQGEKSLLDLKWEAATTQWGDVQRNKNAAGQPLSVHGVPVSEPGIGTHANSLIHFRIPKGFKRFQATGALDTGGTSQSGGTQSSVSFAVYGGAPPDVIAAKERLAGLQHAPENATAGLTVGDGLAVTLAASEPDIRSLTNLDIDDRGRVWVCDVMNYRGNNGSRPEGDRILILEDTTGDGVMDKVKTYYQGRDIDSAMGICVLGNQVIVSGTPTIWRFTDEDGDDRPDRKEAIFTETGQPQHDHSNHSFLFGPDGKLYWNFGNTGKAVRDAKGELVVDIHGRPVIDNGNPFFGGMPFRCNLDGSEFEVLAHNFRNNYEVTVDSFGTLWQSDNDDDGNRGVRINFVMEHGNYGYRDERTGAGWREERIGMHEEIPKRHWHLRDPGVVPNVLQTGAGSPCGICVYEGRLLPERFWDQMIHCDAGPNVVRAYPVQRDGAGYTASIEPLLVGEQDNWFRPADVCVAPDGSVFVTDWYDPGVGGHRQEDTDRGRLFRIAPPATGYTVPQFDYSTAAGAAAALRNPNLAVRYKAWTALHAMGTKAEAELLKLWKDENPRIRARALWLLGKISGEGNDYVAAGLADDHPDIRTTAIRLGRQLNMTPSAYLAGIAEDPSPAVRREALVALRFDDSDAMPSLWSKLAQRYDGDRWYLEALGLASDLRSEACFAAWLDAVGERWDTPRGRDIVWRMRAPQAAMRMAEIVRDPSLQLAETDRYFRSFEFHPEAVRNEALKTLLTPVARTAANHDGAAQAHDDAIIVRALQRMSGIDWRADDQVRAAVERHTQRHAESPELVALVEQFQLTDAGPMLLAYALHAEDSSSAVQAIEALSKLNGGQQLVTGALFGDNDATAQRIADLLALLGGKWTTEPLAKVVMDGEQPFPVRAAAVRGLAKSKPGAEILLTSAKRETLPADVRLLAGGLLSRDKDAKIRERSAQLLPLPSQKDQAPLAPIDQLATMRGSLERGEKLFRGVATCANCHTVNGVGKEVGPDLSEIGKKLSREAMYVSILDPSAGISHNYENHVVLLDSGQVVSGILVSQTDNSLTLRTAEAIDRTFGQDEVELLKKSEQSLMPADVQSTIDQQGLIDIVEYMTSLEKKQGEAAAGSAH